MGQGGGGTTFQSLVGCFDRILKCRGCLYYHRDKIYNSLGRGNMEGFRQSFDSLIVQFYWKLQHLFRIDAHFITIYLEELTPMKSAQIIHEFTKSETYKSLLQAKQIEQNSIRDLLKEYFPKIGISDKADLSVFLNDQEVFDKLQRILEMHQELFSRIQSIEQQINLKSRVNSDENDIGSGKKVTRAALARRQEKNRQEIRKDQIFVRLTPKSQGCIQFMLSNRNFPRIECKLSCNQHLEYLVNYLTNKWVRGKVGYKLVLYPDNSFLKALPLAEKQKSLKQPLNNYLMFTDIMTCCGVTQNGVLNLCYEIVEIKKMTKGPIEPNSHNENMSAEADQGENASKSTPKEKGRVSLPSVPEFTVPTALDKSKEDKPETLPIKATTPSKISSKDEYIKEGSMFNRNSNFYNNHDQSFFGSLGFNFNFGSTPAKRDQNVLSFNSISYLDPHYQEAKKMQEEKQEKESSNQVKCKVEEANESVSEKSSQPQPQLQPQLRKQVVKKQEKQAEIKHFKDQAPQDMKLGTLMSILQQIQREKQANQMNNLNKPRQQPQNNSNKAKDVKLVNIVKKRTSYN